GGGAGRVALEPLRNVLERVLHGRARPSGLHHHGLYDEGRVLAAAEPVIGGKASTHSNNHEVGDDRTMVQRPVREVEAAHGSDPSMRTIWPGCRASTPAVTIVSTASTPPDWAPTASP